VCSRILRYPCGQSTQAADQYLCLCFFSVCAFTAVPLWSCTSWHISGWSWLDAFSKPAMSSSLCDESHLPRPCRRPYWSSFKRDESLPTPASPAVCLWACPLGVCLWPAPGHNAWPACRCLPLLVPRIPQVEALIGLRAWRMVEGARGQTGTSCMLTSQRAVVNRATVVSGCVNPVSSVSPNCVR
jgi:hypothetical protein